MEVERIHSDYDNTDFAQTVAKIKANPELLDTKEKLIEFWQYAIDQRNKDNTFQDYIATGAARCRGIVEYDNVEGDPYQDIVLQFHYMDHMHEGYGERADEEWGKVAEMLTNLRSKS